MDKKYNSNNIDKVLNRMENADTLKEINRKSTNIMSFFNDIEKDNKLEKQKSAAELKKEQYLLKIKILKELLQKKDDKDNITRVISIGALIETTDFLNLKLDRKKILKESMIWCNKIYKKYINEN